MAQITHIQNNAAELDTHTSNIEETIEAIKERLRQSSNLTLPLEKSLDLLEQLSQFALGRFLLLNRGCNGYWTSYLTLPFLRKNPLHPLEEWLLTRTPSILSTQERFKIFQQQAQKHLKPGMKIASIPCGLMDDLLSLDYHGLESVEIVGIDLDPESIRQAQKNYHQYSLNNKVTFLQLDAWDLNIRNRFDLITSSGLNTYEPDTKKAIDLYKNFYNALCSNGVLIIPFLLPPPHSRSTWQTYGTQDVLVERAILSDILQVKWQNHCTEDQMRQHLHEAGFTDVKGVYDTRKIILTAIAKKL